MGPQVVSLTSAGVRIYGWSSVTIRKSLDAAADDFSLELTNRRIGGLSGTTSFRQVLAANDLLQSSDKVVIDVDGETILTGYIDELGINYDARQATMRVSGRSRTGDLCDCSATHGTGRGGTGVGGVWQKATLETIARDLCEPFGISVIVAAGLADKPFERFRLEPGETVFEAIARAAEKRQVIPTCNAKGNLEFVRAAETPSGAVLENGVNVLAATFTNSIASRFSEYRFRGQTFAEDNWNGAQASQLQGSAQDTGVGRYRPYVVNNGKAKSSEDLGARAIWERNMRAGRSFRYRCTVEDWTTQKAGKKAWLVNQVARVRDTYCGIDADMLITGVTLTLTESERLTELELCDRAAYVAQTKVKLKNLASAARPDAAVGRLFNVGAIDAPVFNPSTVGRGTVRLP